MESPAIPADAINIKTILCQSFGLKDCDGDRCIEDVGEEMTGDTGFLSFRRRMRIKKGETTICVFLKFSDKSRHDLGQLQNFCNHFCPRECLFYGCFAPLLERTAAQLGIGSIGLPTVYQELVQPTGTIIVMEDLGEAGFELAPAVMNADEARCILSSLARVQAAFWLTRARLGGQADALLGPASPMRDSVKSLAEAGINFGDMLTGYFHIFRREFIKYLKSEKRIAIINAYLDNGFLDKSREALSSDQGDTEVLGVTHGDLWYNNCMLRRDTSGQPVECRLIDWQVFSLGTPGHDFGLLWISSIDNALVIDELLPCIDFFHDSVRSLCQVGLPDQEFPASREQMRRWAIDSLRYGIIMTVMSVEILSVIRRPDNWLANIADLIERFNL